MALNEVSFFHHFLILSLTLLIDELLLDHQGLPDLHECVSHADLKMNVKRVFKGNYLRVSRILFIE